MEISLHCLCLLNYDTLGSRKGPLSSYVDIVCIACFSVNSNASTIWRIPFHGYLISQRRPICRPSQSVVYAWQTSTGLSLPKGGRTKESPSLHLNTTLLFGYTVDYQVHKSCTYFPHNGKCCDFLVSICCLCLVSINQTVTT